MDCPSVLAIASAMSWTSHDSGSAFRATSESRSRLRRLPPVVMVIMQVGFWWFMQSRNAFADVP